MKKLVLILLVLCGWFGHAQYDFYHNALLQASSSPYTAGTNEFPAMVGNVDSPDSTAEWPGGWTVQGDGSWSVETTIVRSGTTTSLKVDNSGSTTSHGVRSFSWNPTGQAAGQVWRWEGYVYVPAGTTSVTLQISDNTTGATNYDVTGAAGHATDTWVWFSFDHSQGSTNTFSMWIQTNNPVYFSGMKWTNITT